MLEVLDDVNHSYIDTGTISAPFVEGSCVTDPCWYAVPGATGKEVVILDLYPNTGGHTSITQLSCLAHVRLQSFEHSC